MRQRKCRKHIIQEKLTYEMRIKRQHKRRHFRYIWTYSTENGAKLKTTFWCIIGRNIFKRFILLNLIFVHKKYDTKYLYMCICMFMYFVLGCTSESITHVVIYCWQPSMTNNKQIINYYSSSYHIMISYFEVSSCDYFNAH